MAKYIGPKCKICRREGEKLFLRGDRCHTSKCAIVKRNYPPGLKGVAGARPRLTVYGQQLRTKQKVKRIYNILEKQFRIIFDKANKLQGDTGENFLKMLERRLDNILYRAMFVKSRSISRQVISHGHILVNGKKVDIPSYLVRVGDMIELKDKSKNNGLFKHLEKQISKNDLPGWLSVDEKKATIKVVSEPDIADLYDALNIKLIVEFYSR